MAEWILGEFQTPSALLKAVAQLRSEGHQALDTYSPFPLHGSSESLGLPKSRIPMIALMGGLIGATAGYLVQWLTNGVDWPLNVGGRPPHSAPVFIPITFESGVLFSALSIFFGLWLILKLPQPYHPVFESEAFRTASTSRFWLSLESEADDLRTRKLVERLQKLGALQVSVVPERK